MQGIFINDEIGISFSNVRIENNLIYDTKAYTNGIMVARWLGRRHSRQHRRQSIRACRAR